MFPGLDSEQFVGRAKFCQIMERKLLSNNMNQVKNVFSSRYI
jgi:hypothetical protein